MEQKIEMPNRPTITAREVALVLDVSVQTVYRWHNEGKLIGFRTPGRSLRFLTNSIIEMMQTTE